MSFNKKVKLQEDIVRILVDKLAKAGEDENTVEVKSLKKEYNIANKTLKLLVKNENESVQKYK